MFIYNEQLEAVFRVVEVTSDTSFSWYGWTMCEMELAFAALLSTPEKREFLIASLRKHLYQRFYCTGFPVRQTRVTGFAKPGTPSSLADQLSDANAGKGYRESGWQVIGPGATERSIVVERDSLKLEARRYEIAGSGRVSSPPSIGQTVSFLLPKEYFHLSPGYYMAQGETEFNPESNRGLVRFYWNLDPDGAVPFIRESTRQLNRAAIAFIAKVLDDAGRFDRRDSAIIYIARCDLERAAAELGHLSIVLGDYCGVGIPAFTLRLGQGIGFAEDPPGVDSFGWNRCGLLAEGIVRAYERQATTLAEWLQSVEAAFEESEVDLRTPYVSTNSLSQYDFEGLGDLFQGNWRRAHSLPTPARKDLLYAALQLANQIVEDAIWYEGRCTWIGAEPEVAHFGTAEAAAGQATHLSLGPEVYHGTSGIAVFLAELFVATGIEKFRETAVGAIRHAMAYVPDLMKSTNIGFYTGWPGILVTAAYVGFLIEAIKVTEAVDHLASDDDIFAQVKKADFDFTSGKAGGVVAFLIMDRFLNRDMLTHATLLGDLLIAEAETQGEISSWRSTVFPDRVNLLGFSHGTAGVGLALTELTRSSGDSRYQVVADRAFNYERRYFDAAEQNWPDFRDKLGSKDWKKDGYLNFMTSWCHGAPGIALTRLRAYEITHDARCLAEARVALNTTARILRNSFEAGNGNFSLCHGWCGNADVLLYGHSVLGAECNDYLNLVERVASVAIHKFARAGRELPLGIAGGYSPNLMLGTSGVGYFYLRLLDRDIPSILIPSPDRLLHRKAPTIRRIDRLSRETMGRRTA